MRFLGDRDPQKEKPTAKIGVGASDDIDRHAGEPHFNDPLKQPALHHVLFAFPTVHVTPDVAT